MIEIQIPWKNSCFSGKMYYRSFVLQKLVSLLRLMLIDLVITNHRFTINTNTHISIILK